MKEIFELLPEHHGRRVIVHHMGDTNPTDEAKVYLAPGKTYYLLSNSEVLDGEEVYAPEEFREGLNYSFTLGGGEESNIRAERIKHLYFKCTPLQPDQISNIDNLINSLYELS